MHNQNKTWLKRAAYGLAAAVLAVLALTACGDGGDDSMIDVPDAGLPELGDQTTATEPSGDATQPSEESSEGDDTGDGGSGSESANGDRVSAVLDKAGCEGQTTTPDEHAAQQARCTIDGATATVAVFETAEDRDAWTAAQEESAQEVTFGDEPELWAAASLTADGPVAVEEALSA